MPGNVIAPTVILNEVAYRFQAGGCLEAVASHSMERPECWLRVTRENRDSRLAVAALAVLHGPAIQAGAAGTTTIAGDVVLVLSAKEALGLTLLASGGAERLLADQAAARSSIGNGAAVAAAERALDALRFAAAGTQNTEGPGNG